MKNYFNGSNNEHAKDQEGHDSNLSVQSILQNSDAEDSSVEELLLIVENNDNKAMNVLLDKFLFADVQNTNAHNTLINALDGLPNHEVFSEKLEKWGQMRILHFLCTIFTQKLSQLDSFERVHLDTVLSLIKLLSTQSAETIMILCIDHPSMFKELLHQVKTCYFKMSKAQAMSLIQYLYKLHADIVVYFEIESLNSKYEVPQPENKSPFAVLTAFAGFTSLITNFIKDIAYKNDDQYAKQHYIASLISNRVNIDCMGSHTFKAELDSAISQGFKLSDFDAQLIPWYSKHTVGNVPVLSSAMAQYIHENTKIDENPELMQTVLAVAAQRSDANMFHDVLTKCSILDTPHIEQAYIANLISLASSCDVAHTLFEQSCWGSVKIIQTLIAKGIDFNTVYKHVFSNILERLSHINLFCSQEKYKVSKPAVVEIAKIFAKYPSQLERKNSNGQIALSRVVQFIYREKVCGEPDFLKSFLDILVDSIQYPVIHQSDLSGVNFTSKLIMLGGFLSEKGYTAEEEIVSSCVSELMNTKGGCSSLGIFPVLRSIETDHNLRGRVVDSLVSSCAILSTINEQWFSVSAQKVALYQEVCVRSFTASFAHLFLRDGFPSLEYMAIRSLSKVTKLMRLDEGCLYHIPKTAAIKMEQLSILSSGLEPIFGCNLSLNDHLENEESAETIKRFFRK